MRLNFASTRLAFVLIAILFVLLLLSAIIPQRHIAENQVLDWQELLGDNYVIIDKLALDRIYFTPTFFVVLGLLGINLLVSNVKRFRRIFKSERSLWPARHIGSIVFHLSLLLIMTAVILNYLYKYDGLLAVTEGQTVSDQAGNYFREFHGPLYTDSYGRFELKLQQMKHADDSTSGPGSIAAVELLPAKGAVIDADISTNHPLQLGDWEIHYGMKSGYSPECVVLGDSGAVLFQSFVRLAYQQHSGAWLHKDFLVVPGTDLKVEMEVVPSADPDRSEVLRTKIFGPDRELFEGELQLGDTATAGAYKFVVPRLRRWCYLDVVRSPFLNLVFAGFWLALSGMTLNLIGRIRNRKAV